jgi:hypothetical protein
MSSDDDDARLIYLLDWLEPLGYDAERIFRDRTYARQVRAARMAARTRATPRKRCCRRATIKRRTSTESNAVTQRVALWEWMRFHGGAPERRWRD